MSKILIIDDDRDFQESIQMVLESNNFETASAYDSEEGINKIRSENPDLVILDVVLPSNYEGFEVARKVREELDIKKLPIIILTAVHDKKRVPYRFAPDEQWLPVDYFFDKPVKPDTLLAKIKEILNIPDSGREGRSYY
ncbi:MAG: response regulator [Spirochaetota bacterium]